MSLNVALANFHETLRCDDYNAQTTNNICVSGICQGCPTNDCVIAAGTFDTVTQQCSAPTVKADGATCDSETTDKFGAALRHRMLYPTPLNQVTWTFRVSHWSSKSLQSLCANWTNQNESDRSPKHRIGNGCP